MSTTAPGVLPNDLARLTEASRRAFSETSDPAAYVERPAVATALDSVLAWLADKGARSTLAAIVAPPGLGKTMLLRVVEARLNERGLAAGTPAARPNAIYLPYAGLEPTDLAIWVHGLLGRSCPAVEGDTEAIGALCALGEAAAAPLTLLVDDADSMPMATIEALIHGLDSSPSPLRLLLALNPDSKGSRLLAALHAMGPREIRYRERLSATETGEYVRARMRWAGFPEAAIARVDEDEAQRIHALSNGVPRAIHGIAADRFNTATAVGGTEELGAKRLREDWMGRPIEDDLEI